MKSTEKKYKKIEKTFLKYVDTATIKKVCEETDKEPFVDVPKKMLVNDEPIQARITILEKLTAANKMLKKINRNYQLKALDGYRPMEIQVKNFNETVKRLKQQLIGKTEIEFWEACHKQIAVPEVACHPTGGAVDVVIFDMQTEKPLDFGTEYCEWEAGHKLYYASPEISKLAKQNRKLLRRVMLKQGFLQYMAEWWHFSYGDKEWAAARKKRKALYSQKNI